MRNSIYSIATIEGRLPFSNCRIGDEDGMTWDDFFIAVKQKKAIDITLTDSNGKCAVSYDPVMECFRHTRMTYSCEKWRFDNPSKTIQVSRLPG